MCWKSWQSNFCYEHCVAHWYVTSNVSISESPDEAARSDVDLHHHENMPI